MATFSRSKYYQVTLQYIFRVWDKNGHTLKSQSSIVVSIMQLQKVEGLYCSKMYATTQLNALWLSINIKFLLQSELCNYKFECTSNFHCYKIHSTIELNALWFFISNSFYCSQYYEKWSQIWNSILQVHQISHQLGFVPL